MHGPEKLVTNLERNSSNSTKHASCQTLSRWEVHLHSGQTTERSVTDSCRADLRASQLRVLVLTLPLQPLPSGDDCDRLPVDRHVILSYCVLLENNQSGCSLELCDNIGPNTKLFIWC